MTWWAILEWRVDKVLHRSRLTLEVSESLTICQTTNQDCFHQANRVQLSRNKQSFDLLLVNILNAQNLIKHK